VLRGVSTMVRLQLDERQWQRIKAALGMGKRAGRPGRDDRNFYEAVPWWRRMGAPWRALPSDSSRITPHRSRDWLVARA